MVLWLVFELHFIYNPICNLETFHLRRRVSTLLQLLWFWKCHCCHLSGMPGICLFNKWHLPLLLGENFHSFFFSFLLSKRSLNKKDSYFCKSNGKLISYVLELLISNYVGVAQLDSLGLLLCFYLGMEYHFIAFIKWIIFVFTWEKNLMEQNLMQADFYLLRHGWNPCFSILKSWQMLAFSSSLPAKVPNYNYTFFPGAGNLYWPVCFLATGLTSLLLGGIICEMWVAPPHILGDVVRILMFAVHIEAQGCTILYKFKVLLC